MAAVTTGRCSGCGICLPSCPKSAIRPVPRRSPATSATLLVLADKCDDCALCVEVCPVGAIGLSGPAPL